MANPQPNNELLSRPMRIAEVGGFFVEDVVSAVLGFIPNGLHLIYDSVLKPLPLVGKFFSHRWVEQVGKLCTGITIGQGLAMDISRFIFRPLGFCIGALLGSFFEFEPRYQAQISKLLYRLSGKTVGGALLAMLVLTIANLFFSIDINLSARNLMIAAGIGAIFGLLSRVFYLVAIDNVNKANAATVRRNVKRAKELGAKLKNVARQKAKGIILREAQDIIQQMNGPNSANIQEFLSTEYDTISIYIHDKIERHFNYLTDRACFGDLQALKLLQELNPSRNTQTKKSSFDLLIQRLFNARTIFKLKDDVDTAFDRWQYRYLSADPKT